MTAKQDKGEGRNQEEGERLRLPGCGGAGGRASKSRLPPAPLQDSRVPAQPLGVNVQNGGSSGIQSCENTSGLSRLLAVHPWTQFT